MLDDFNVIFDAEYEKHNKSDASRTIFAQTVILWYVSGATICLLHFLLYLLQFYYYLIYFSGKHFI